MCKDSNRDIFIDSGPIPTSPFPLHETLHLFLLDLYIPNLFEERLTLDKRFCQLLVSTVYLNYQEKLRVTMLDHLPENNSVYTVPLSKDKSPLEMKEEMG